MFPLCYVAHDKVMDSNQGWGSSWGGSRRLHEISNGLGMLSIGNAI